MSARLATRMGAIDHVGSRQIVTCRLKRRARSAQSELCGRELMRIGHSAQQLALCPLYMTNRFGKVCMQLSEGFWSACCEQLTRIENFRMKLLLDGSCLQLFSGIAGGQQQPSGKLRYNLSK
jgi:hypothetical protein